MNVRSITRLMAGVASARGATVTGGLWLVSFGADVLAMMQGKAWVLIGPLSGRGETGWAFARYLDCDGGE